MRARVLIILGVVVIIVLAFLALVDSESPRAASKPAVENAPAHPKIPLLAARRAAAASAGGVSTEGQTNLLARLLAGEDIPKLTLDQVQGYLDANHRNAESLLAAARATGDRSLLREAMEKFPNDPHVDFEAWFRGDSPEEKRKWLDQLKKSAPDNAMAAYLSAADYFKAGQKDAGLADLGALANNAKFNDYTADFLQSMEETYRSAGYSEAEAKMVSGTELLLPQLAPLKQLGKDLTELSKSYSQAGDADSARVPQEMALNLAQQVMGQPGQARIIDDLVGMAIQRIVLESMDPAAPYGASGGTVKDQLDQIAQRKQDLKGLTGPSMDMLKSMPEQDLATYFEREKFFGEEAALRWAFDRAGIQPGQAAIK